MSRENGITFVKAVPRRDSDFQAPNSPSDFYYAIQLKYLTAGHTNTYG